MTAAPKRLIWMCAVCRRVLDLHVDPDGATYRHTFGDAMRADHVAVPIRVDDPAQVRSRCDFCGRDVERPWIVPAREFSVEPWGSFDADWAADEECARLIRTNQWTALLNRSVDGYIEMNPQDNRAFAARAVGRLQRLIRKHITGPPYLPDVSA